jgi:allantoin racemase
MRILVVNIPAAEEGSESGQFIKTVLASLMRRNFDLFKQKDTELTLRFPRQGMVAEPWAECRYIDRINPESMLPSIIRGEKEGFDAVVVACFHDALILKEARDAVTIPVVGIAESSILMAALSGRRFGIVEAFPHPFDDLNKRVADLDLNKQFVGATYTRESAREQEMALTDARREIERFKEAARELILGGAELLLTSCGLMPPVLQLAPGAEKEYPNGITDVDGVPIMNSMGNALKMAEMLVEAKETGFRPTVRNGGKAHAPDSDGSAGFWDC